jgi:ketosteroid isomerase-like protein
MTAAEIDVLGRFLTAVLGGDSATLKELVSPECVVHEPADLPYGGDYVGVDGLLEMFGAVTRDLDFSVTGRPELLPVGDGRVLVRMIASFVHRTSARTASFPIAEIYTVRDGQIVDIDVFYKEPGAIRALLETSA